MAQIVKAVKMILRLDTVGSLSNTSVNHMARDIEIEDDAPRRKPSLEEIDALEVHFSESFYYTSLPNEQSIEN